MVKWLKLFLSVVILFWACERMEQVNGSEKVELQITAESIMQPEYQKLYDAGIARGYMQGSEKQLAFLDSLNQHCPDYANGWFERSAWAIKSADYIKYFECMEKAIELEPMINLGWRANLRLYYLRDYKGAIADYEMLIGLTNKKDAPARAESARFGMGKAYIKLGDYPKAIENLSISIEEESKENGPEWIDPYVFYYRGIAHYKNGDKQSALKNFNLCLKYYENCAEALFYKGLVLSELNDTSAACEVLANAERQHKIGYWEQEPYVETLLPVFLEDIQQLQARVCRD